MHRPSACILLASFLALPAEAQFGKLVKRVPNSVNTIILLNAEKVLNSEVALREGWRTNFEKAIAAGLTHLPPDTLQYVMASQMDFEYMHPVWQLGILSTSKKHDMVYIASKQKGTQDTIAGLPAVLLPSENYLVQFDPTTYATMVPASRQAVSRWIKSTAKESAEFSPYIHEAIGYSDESGTEIIMAMDLTDVLDLDTVRGLVKESKLLADAGVDVEAASKVLASLRGVMLGITFGAKPFGSIKVDFGEDASVLKGVGPQLLLTALAKHGAMIDDFAKWESKVNGKQLRLTGKFSASGMRQVFSLMDPPTAASVRQRTVAIRAPVIRIPPWWLPRSISLRSTSTFETCATKNRSGSLSTASGSTSTHGRSTNCRWSTWTTTCWTTEPTSLSSSAMPVGRFKELAFRAASARLRATRPWPRGATTITTVGTPTVESPTAGTAIEAATHAVMAAVLAATPQAWRNKPDCGRNSDRGRPYGSKRRPMALPRHEPS